MDDCRFCEIVKNGSDLVLYENEHNMAILDHAPGSRGHLFIIPKKHYTNIFDIPREEYLKMTDLSYVICHQVTEILEADGAKIAMNNGECADQKIYHIHLHVMPMFKDRDTIIDVNNTRFSEDIKAVSYTHLTLPTN